jgi:HlyD family secretion protein
MTRISDKAEFNPQNVQSNEQRQTTVYEVQLTIDNMGGKLKPGMPMNVTFASQASGR